MHGDEPIITELVDSLYVGMVWTLHFVIHFNFTDHEVTHHALDALNYVCLKLT